MSKNGLEILDLNSPQFKASFNKYVRTVGALQEEYENADTYYKKLQAIKKYYLAYEKEMIAKPRQWQSVYPIDWSRLFTPIEFEAWQSIRSIGRTVLYPQYPALNYHLDFANPGLRIALEIDGKDFHDKEKDTIRDTELKKVGWTVYRVTGSEMVNHDYKTLSECYNEEMEDEGEILSHIKHWIMNTGNGVIQAIKQVHFEDWSKEENVPYIPMQFLSYCHSTLDAHRLV